MALVLHFLFLIFLYSLTAFLIRRSRPLGCPLSLFALDRWLRYNIYDFVFLLNLTVRDIIKKSLPLPLIWLIVLAQLTKKLTRVGWASSPRSPIPKLSALLQSYPFAFWLKMLDSLLQLAMPGKEMNKQILFQLVSIFWKQNVFVMHINTNR